MLASDLSNKLDNNGVYKEFDLRLALKKEEKARVLSNPKDFRDFPPERRPDKANPKKYKVPIALVYESEDESNFDEDDDTEEEEFFDDKAVCDKPGKDDNGDFVRDAYYSPTS
ncbi:hypothetical protein LTR78_010946 [Recurvomyces mirabilis]|uniref:Uncharacterized protein n=1 Tax=Recurvomyces mirabilis TaxID=574656 RepID=A0AAE0WFZ8_9PEZI|nr:hypothetical protein LTR78_010946 [Recurvomyces mirabilis]KAK5149462.1 hypothetical protein LTS14_010913 [Recurvomyces mirabilis]